MLEIKSDKTVTEIISHTKSLLRITDAEQDALLEALLEDAYAFAVEYSGQEAIPSGALSRMVSEDYSKSYGILSRTRAGMREDYENGYSPSVITALNSIRRLRCV